MKRFQVIDQNGMMSGIFISPDLASFLAEYNDGRWGPNGQFSVLQIPDDAEFIQTQRKAAYPSWDQVMEAWIEHEAENRSDKWAAIVSERAAVKAQFPKTALLPDASSAVVYPVPVAPPVVSQPAPAAPVSAASVAPADDESAPEAGPAPQAATSP